MPGELNYTYRVYDLIVSSQLEIKELKPCEVTSTVDFTVKFADLELLQQHEVLWQFFQPTLQAL